MSGTDQSDGTQARPSGTAGGTSGPVTQPIIPGGGNGPQNQTADTAPDPDAIANFESDISAIVNDDNFVSNLRSNFMEKISNKRGFFRELMSCIFVKPIGVRKLDIASGAGISNREYQAFGADVVAYLKKNHSARFNKMQAMSPLFKRYRCVWPECSDMITNDILSLGNKIEQQKKIQEMLGRTPAPVSGQPVANVVNTTGAAPGGGVRLA